MKFLANKHLFSLLDISYENSENDLSCIKFKLSSGKMFYQSIPLDGGWFSPYPKLVYFNTNMYIIYSCKLFVEHIEAA